ncbi:hypothetical protein N0V93_006037 [Gnomoniopsis smithogilvyi]|uniref:DUF7704 domain-containing protein n=1 Tax=Gnomoniopsis smithogilvyi TaxID=1191159 RepID=A0A9W9CUD0_9PEZI|nr:hypothetical protein N0V93_006037 [Gnomoniopsis smithogilvyi]
MSFPSQIAPIYRVWHLYIEPFSAFYGAVLCARSPLLYLSVMSPRANRSHFNSEVQVVFDQLAATYLLFAFNQGVVLRIADGNLRIWRALLAGMLICDLVHIWGTSKALGPSLFVPVEWRFYDWVNVIMLIIPVLLRSAFLAGVGVKEGEKKAASQPGTSGRQTRSKTKTG